MTFFGLPFQDIVFYTLAAILLYAALRVITTRNPVYAALYLVLAFFTAAGVWLLLEAEFLAIVLVLVYVGAVMVLFLFVVMMLDINLDKLREGFWKALPIALPVGGLMAVEMVMIVGVRNFGADKIVAPAARPADYSNTAELGRVLYTDYLLPFELASVVLLVAIIAAIALTLRDRRESKSVDPAKQVLVKKADRIRIVKMDAVVEKDSEASSDVSTVAKEAE
ncbi:NADH-quinone oxidoreductase subunit J [Methylotenera sp.]|uniref:NADH-quinone oxidoreductase subunit J n=1 Tax=Methylotenera sp. TaxID=2051956 RepID=UPI0027306BCC|nr:NADH-quinone oxidoreductase subunit J [Methylotenera sp.]MDP2072284.1 NADH-quinone oxidoreductase subunit J [Methylotenera sp.]MDP2231051.1 NADH-quinone oxidoreductase subunit J [Methylotenera sp.]MDP3005083.1 NADH-quinone oxidoreductase subunit J [Methylotenera sp.]MDP3141300.1 NADH-quinone oxidoreductase subunit J [Methylotenera sp.]